MNTDEGYEEEVDEELPAAMEDSVTISSPQGNTSSPPSHTNQPPHMKGGVKKEPSDSPPTATNSGQSTNTTPPLTKKEPLSPTKPPSPRSNVIPTPVPTPMPASLKVPPAPFIPHVGANILPANSMMLNQEGLLPMPSAMAKRVAVSYFICLFLFLYIFVRVYFLIYKRRIDYIIVLARSRKATKVRSS